ncbi:MAG: nucleotidyltransferase family protein [Bacteroidota bacterium]
MFHTAIIILAAGASTRLGTPKQLLPWGNRTLLENAIDMATDSGAAEVIVVTGANEQIIRSKTNRPDAKYVNNENWVSGMGSSIATGISYVLTNSADIQSVIIMLCDQPQVDSQYLNKLIDLHQLGQKAITATDYQNRPGVPAIFDQQYFDELIKLQTQGGAKKLMSQKSKDIYLFSPDTEIHDIDTQEDYQRLLNLLEP